MTPIKLYVFVDERDEVITQVRSTNYYQALSVATNSHPQIDEDTDFYSTEAA